MVIIAGRWHQTGQAGGDRARQEMRARPDGAISKSFRLQYREHPSSNPSDAAAPIAAWSSWDPLGWIMSLNITDDPDCLTLSIGGTFVASHALGFLLAVRYPDTRYQSFDKGAAADPGR